MEVILAFVFLFKSTNLTFSLRAIRKTLRLPITTSTLPYYGVDTPKGGLDMKMYHVDLCVSLQEKLCTRKKDKLHTGNFSTTQAFYSIVFRDALRVAQLLILYTPTAPITNVRIPQVPCNGRTFMRALRVSWKEFFFAFFYTENFACRIVKEDFRVAQFENNNTNGGLHLLFGGSIVISTLSNVNFLLQM